MLIVDSSKSGIFFPNMLFFAVYTKKKIAQLQSYYVPM
jgi:hypothetical protein